jgi:hypothetical protein
LGQLWQAFIGIGARRVKGYYEGLLAAEGGREGSNSSDSPTTEGGDGKPKASQAFSSEKWKGQIEKVCRLLCFFTVNRYNMHLLMSSFTLEPFRICLEHFQGILH